MAASALLLAGVVRMAVSTNGVDPVRAALTEEYGAEGNPEHLERLRAVNKRLRAENAEYKRHCRELMDETTAQRLAIKRLKYRVTSLENLIAHRRNKPTSDVIAHIDGIYPAVESVANYLRGVYAQCGVDPPEDPPED